MHNRFNSFPSHLALFFLCAVLAFSAACNRVPSQATASSAGTRRYPFNGKVISIDKQAETASIDNQPIAGFMDSMVMPYSIKPPTALDQLKPGDSIAAEVVVQADNTYWLESVQVTGHVKPAAGK